MPIKGCTVVQLYNLGHKIYESSNLGFFVNTFVSDLSFITIIILLYFSVIGDDI